MKISDKIRSFFCMQKPKEEAVAEYTYTYYAQTVMGNWSKRGTFTFTVTEEEMKKHGSAHAAGLQKNYDKLSSPIRPTHDGMMKYRVKGGINDETN